MQMRDSIEAAMISPLLMVWADGVLVFTYCQP
jgi:hypothetical protein